MPLDEAEPPKFVQRVAWRATVASETVSPWMREPEITLWLGHKTHLVHYPVRAGQEINIVAIAARSLERAGLERTERRRTR